MRIQNCLTVSWPATPKSATGTYDTGQRRDREGEREKRTEFGLAIKVEQNVSCLNVPVNFALEVEVLQTLEGTLQDVGDLIFFKLKMGRG